MARLGTHPLTPTGARHDASEGHRTWGEYNLWASARGSVLNHRLVVFPPGISAARSRLLRAWRSWPQAALLSLILVAVLMTVPLFGRLLAAVIAAAFAGVYLTLARKTEPERGRVRQLRAVDLGEQATADDLARCTQLRLLYLRLARADEQLALGELSRAEHAEIWCEVYERML